MENNRTPRLLSVAVLVVTVIALYCYHDIAKRQVTRAQQDIELVLEQEQEALDVLEENAEEFGLPMRYYGFLDRALAAATTGYKRSNHAPKYGLDGATAWINDQHIPPRDRQLMIKVLSERLAASRMVITQQLKPNKLETCRHTAATFMGGWFDINCPQPSMAIPSLAVRHYKSTSQIADEARYDAQVGSREGVPF